MFCGTNRPNPKARDVVEKMRFCDACKPQECQKCEGICKRWLPKGDFDQTETSNLMKKCRECEAGAKRDAKYCPDMKSKYPRSNSI
eukprot:6287714-Pyramimonas_sp.AAC.1